MKALSVLLLALVICPPVQARDRAPFEPAYAATQSQITSESLEHEAEQFEEFGEWHTALDNAAMSRTEAALLRKEQARAEHLVKVDQITVEAGIIAKFKHDNALIQVTRYEAEAEHARASAMVAKLKLLQEGNPENDYRLDLTRARLEAREYYVKVLQAMLSSVEIEQELHALKLKGGKELLKRSTVSQRDFDMREFNHQNATERAAALRSQILVTQDTIEALKLTISELQ